MDIRQTTVDGVVTLHLVGRLDTNTCMKLQETSLPILDEGKSLVFDFAGLDYVSSAGLRVILMAQKRAKAKGGTLAIRHVAASIMEILEMTGFAEILHIES